MESFNDKIHTANSFNELFNDIARELGSEFKKTIEAEIFAWDRTTVRKNTLTVMSPRDIVDLGKLKNSQSMSIEP